jgi:hypothetical protein
VVSPTSPETIRITRRELAGAPAGFRVADRMDRLTTWSLQKDDQSLAGYSDPDTHGLPIRVPGDFALTQVEDREKGSCLELKLHPKGELPPIISEYAVLKLRQPVPVSGKPTTIGLWVNGDSGWGKIIFEIQDATGALWRTEGDWHDWPGDLSICYDGWGFISFPIDGSSKVRNISPSARWSSPLAKPGDSIKFPIKIVGLGVMMNRQALDLTDMKKVRGVLRFRDLGTCAPENTDER